ncbi:MAG: chemotaxis protein CheW [Archangiaceae bacterium]|nr:chemotaxis protein CheW [Archangiaceae bacterium]
MSGSVQLCAFRAGDEELVVDIMRVQEIIAPLPLTAVPRSPRAIEGVVNLRGAIVPVVDVRKQLGLGEPKQAPRPRLIVCRVGPHLLGLRVDGVSTVFRAERESLKPAPMGQGSSPHIIGVCAAGGKLRLLLDVRALLG